MVRCADADDQRSIQRGRRPTGLQVRDDRLADILGQGQPLIAPALARDPELPGAPVDVLDPERGDLAGTQPQPGEHHQHRVVPAPASTSAIARVKQRLQLLRLKRARQPRQPPRRRRRHRVSQRAGDQTAEMQEPQQRPQAGHRHLRRPFRLPRAPGNDERHDVRRAQPAQIELVALTHATIEKRPHRQHVTLDRVRRQPALDRQVLAVVPKQHLDRADRHTRRRRRNDAEPAQVPQQRRHRPRRDAIRIAGRAPLRQEPLNRLARQPVRTEPLTMQPAAHVRHQLQLEPRRRPPIPQTPQLAREPRRERLQRARNPDPR